KVDPASLKWGELRAGAPIGEVQPIFPRIDKTKTMTEINESASTPAPTEAPAAQPAEAPTTHATQADATGVVSFIEIDDFAKVDLRVGQVLSAERVPKADKLLLLKLD